MFSFFSNRPKTNLNLNTPVFVLLFALYIFNSNRNWISPCRYYINLSTKQYLFAKVKFGFLKGMKRLQQPLHWKWDQSKMKASCLFEEYQTSNWNVANNIYVIGNIPVYTYIYTFIHLFFPFIYQMTVQSHGFSSYLLIYFSTQNLILNIFFRSRLIHFIMIQYSCTGIAEIECMDPGCGCGEITNSKQALPLASPSPQRATSRQTQT